MKNSNKQLHDIIVFTEVLVIIPEIFLGSIIDSLKTNLHCLYKYLTEDLMMLY